MFDYEKRFCFENLVVWLNEANSLFYSAEVLYEFDTHMLVHVFEKDETFSSLFSPDLTNRPCFNVGVQRMLWAYGFENLLKFVILARIERENPSEREIPFGEIKSHDLEQLAQKARIELSESESFYFGVLERCSVWAGRYPLPLKSKQMYDSRRGFPSEEAAEEHSRQTFEKYLSGEIPRPECESDVLHCGVGQGEYSVYEQLRARLMKVVEEISV
jgi:hypothetical protein